MRKSLVFAVPFLAGVTMIVACASKKPNPPTTPTTPAADAGAAAPAGDAGTAMTDAGAAPVGGPVFFTGDAGPAPGPTGSTAPTGSAAPAITDQALDTAIDLAISTAAPKVAPKMAAEGTPGRATLKEGEHFNMVVNLMPNRCYTFVGFSPPGNVAQLDLKLMAMPLNVEAGKSAAADKAMPVMGKGAAAICPIMPVAVPYKIDAVATKGAGRIGVHVFARNK